MDQRVATALLSYLTQTAYQAGQALQDARSTGTTQRSSPSTAGEISDLLQVTLQSAIDGILAEIATLGGATNLVNTWDLLAGTNTVRNLHATGPLSIQLANDDWTLSFSCDAYTTQQTDDAIAAALSNYFTRAEEVTATIVAAIDESKSYTDTQLADYSTTAQMTQAISDALVPFETAVQRDAAIAAALAAYYTSAQTDAALAAGLVPYSTTAQMNQAIADALLPYGTVAQRDAAIAALAAYYTSAQTDAAIAAAIAPYYTSAETDAAVAAAQLSNGQTWNGGPTFNLLRGSNVLRNLSVAGALTASFQNLDDTILIESDSYARSETYTQAETALDLSQFQNEAEVQALIAAALSTYVAGELANYATSSSVTSAMSSALSSSSQVGGEGRGGEGRRQEEEEGGGGRRREEEGGGGRMRRREEEGGGGRRREEEGGGGGGRREGRGGEGREREREERERKRERERAREREREREERRERERESERERARERERERERERDRHRDRANQRSNTCNRPTTQTHLDNTYQMIRDYVLSSLAHIELLAFGILGV